MRENYRLIWWILPLTMLASCGGDFSQRMQEKPSAFGPLSQLNVIADQQLWENVEDSFSYYYEAPYPLMPQPEPAFDLRHFTPSDLVARSSRKHLRTYLLMATTTDTTSATYKIIERDISSFSEGLGENGYKIKIARDKWASNQMIIYIYAVNREKLVAAFSNNYEKIISEIRSFEREALGKQVYIGGEDKEIPGLLLDSFSCKLRLPKAAQLAKINQDIAWIRLETEKSSSNIIISKIPYRSEDQLSKDGMIALRNRITLEHIEGPTPMAYPVVNDENLPVFYDKVSLATYDAYEIRGVWEMENAFMGGPFVTYLVLGPNLESLYFIDLFIYAPGEEKRDLMQHLEYIAFTLQIFPNAR